MKKWFALTQEQKTVRAFYKEFLSWRAENIGTWIGAGLLEIIFWCLMIEPAQAIWGAQDNERELLIEQNRCAMACQGCGAVFLLFSKIGSDRIVPR